MNGRHVDENGHGVQVYSSSCFELATHSSIKLKAHSSAELPFPVTNACHGGDGNRVAFAGKLGVAALVAGLRGFALCFGLVPVLC